MCTHLKLERKLDASMTVTHVSRRASSDSCITALAAEAPPSAFLLFFEALLTDRKISRHRIHTGTVLCFSVKHCSKVVESPVAS